MARQQTQALRQRGNPCCEMQELAAAQFHGLLLDRLYWARVNGRGRAMGAWIDRKCDGLSGCPPKASTPAANQRGTSARPAGPARKLGYLNSAPGGSGHDRLCAHRVTYCGATICP